MTRRLDGRERQRITRVEWGRSLRLLTWPKRKRRRKRLTTKRLLGGRRARHFTVEASRSQGPDNVAVLRLHGLPKPVRQGQVIGTRDFACERGIRRSRGMDNASSVRKQVGRYHLTPWTEIFRLNVKYLARVNDVVVVAKQRTSKRHHLSRAAPGSLQAPLELVDIRRRGCAFDLRTGEMEGALLRILLVFVGRARLCYRGGEVTRLNRLVPLPKALLDVSIDERMALLERRGRGEVRESSLRRDRSDGEGDHRRGPSRMAACTPAIAGAGRRARRFGVAHHCRHRSRSIPAFASRTQRSASSVIRLPTQSWMAAWPLETRASATARAISFGSVTFLANISTSALRAKMTSQSSFEAG